MPSTLNGLFRKLAWTDFTGPVPAGTQFHAATSSNFTVSRPTFSRQSDGFTLDDSVIVTIVFNAGQSWKSPKVDAMPDDQQGFLLDHEQGHYTITALCARDCFIALMQLRSETFKTEASGRSIFDSTVARYRTIKDDLQNKYDNDTDHSQGGVFIPSTSLFTPKPEKGREQKRWELIMERAFTNVRPGGGSSPDARTYKVELHEQARNTPP